MKKILIILAAVAATSFTQQPAKAQVYSNISFNTFYNELSPYGQWVNDPEYGQVWVSDVAGFEPYYNDGHWVYTSYGWTWVSDYSWGWAPFHYGRWTYLSSWGWAWIPGYEWGPAWVNWCQNDGYYGWAPMGPGWSFSMGYNSIPYNYWRFVPQRYITAPAIRTHIVRPDRNRDGFRNVTIINNTQVNNNVTYVAGPRRDAVERVTRQRIDTRPVSFNGNDEKTRVDKKEVRIYRPDLDKRKAALNNDRAVKAIAPVNTRPLDKAGNENVKPVQPNNTVPAIPGNKQLPNNNDDRRVKQQPSTNNNTIDLRNDVKDQQVNKDSDRNQQSAERRQWQQQRIQYQKNAAQQKAQQQADLKQQQDQQAKQQQIQQQRDNEQRLKDQQQNELRQQQQEQLRQQQLQQQRDEQKRQQDQRQNELRQQQQEQMRQQIQQQRDEQRQQQQDRQNQLRKQQQDEMRQQQMQQRMQQRDQMMQQRQNEMRQQRMQQPQIQQPVQRSRRPF